METLKILLDFTAGIAWPLTIAAAFLLFKSEIKSAIRQISSFNRMETHIGGQKLVFSKEEQQKIIQSEIEKTMDQVNAGTDQNREKEISEVASKAAKLAVRLSSLHRDEAFVLQLIKDNPGLSSDYICSLTNKEGRRLGIFVNSGTLTGLEHDGLIKGHFSNRGLKGLAEQGESKVYISEEGKKVLQKLNQLSLSMDVN